MPENRTIASPRQAVWLWWGSLALLAAGLVLFFYRLGGYALLDPDEPFYGETARELLLLKDWWTPHFDFKPWLDKPIFFHWQTATAFWMFGVNEFAARFWPAVMALAQVFLTYRFCLLLGDSRERALRAGLILATSFGFVVLARASVTDQTLAFFMSAALFSFYWGFIRGEKNAYLGLYVFSALATLTKGPMGVLIPFSIIGVFLFLSGRLNWAQIRTMRPFLGTALLLFLAVPWYASMGYLHGAQFVDTFLINYNFGRFFTPEHTHQPFIYYAPVLLVGLLPWSFFFLASLPRLLEHWRRPPMLFVLVWAAFVLVFFSVAATKLPSYVLPLYPAAAILLAAAWDENWGQAPSPGWRWAAALVPLIGVAFLVLPRFAGRLAARYPDALAQAPLPGAVFIVFGGAAAVLLWKRRWAAAFACEVALMLVFIPIAVACVLPVVARYESRKALGEMVAARWQPGDSIAVYGCYRPSLTFYSRQVLEKLETEPQLGQFLAQRRGFCFLKDAVWIAYQQTHPHQAWRSLGLQGKMVLITNEP